MPSDITKSDDGKKGLPDQPIKFATGVPGKFEDDAHDREYMEMTLKAGEHSDLVKKILRKRIAARAKEWPRWPADDAGGVRVMWIESRFWYDRDRYTPDFDDDWRKYRSKYLHSLQLDPREPVQSIEYEKSLINPIRRLYMKPGDWFQANVLEKIAKDKVMAAHYRFNIFNCFLMFMGAMVGTYYLRYYVCDWTTTQGPIIERSRRIMYPFHPDYPFKDPKKVPAHFCEQGFLRRNVYTDLRDFEDSSTAL